METLPLAPVLVCVTEAGILCDRICAERGKSVEYGGVGRAFQVLHKTTTTTCPSRGRRRWHTHQGLHER
jgi:hypothetical protein